MKPMSSIRSASSRTSISTWPRLTRALPAWSRRRPGVATRISMPRAAALCGHAARRRRRRCSERHVAAVGREAVRHLDGELAGRRDDQRTHRMSCGREARVGVPLQPLQHGQHEGGGLARARLGTRHQVAAGKDVGDGQLLHGRRIGVPLLGDGAQDFGREPELIEGHGGGVTPPAEQGETPVRRRGARPACHRSGSGRRWRRCALAPRGPRRDRNVNGPRG